MTGAQPERVIGEAGWAGSCLYAARREAKGVRPRRLPILMHCPRLCSL